MPLRTPAQCRRTVSQRAAASQVGVWVTDSMLAQAIEQYHRAIMLPCRRISSHTGPFESRRRLGKRHMTGLMPTSSAYPPIWQFDVPSTTGMPQWEAPTAPSYRRQKNQQLTVSGLFNNLISWLENPGADKPFIPPLADIATAGTVAVEALALDNTAEQEAIPETWVREAAPSRDLPREIMKLRTSIHTLDEANEETLFRLCRTCRRSLRRRVERRDLSIEALVAALDPLDLATRSRIPVLETANRIAAMIRRTLLSAMADVQKRDGNAVSHELWMTLAEKICDTNGTNHDIQLFWRLMDVMPASLRAQIPSDQIAGLARAFVTAQANRHNLFSHWSARAARFSNALRNLSAVQRQYLDDSMKSFLQQQDWVTEAARRLRFAWQIIKAYDTRATTQEFLAAYRASVEPGVRLHSMQLWQLLAARAIATGAIEREQSKMLMEAEYVSMSQRWTGLVLALLASKNRDSGMRELCVCINGIGEFETIAQALTSPPLRHMRVDAVQAMAAACNDHNQAVQLYDSIAVKDGSRRELGRWDWAAWTKYIERMIKDPKMEPMRVWQVLNLARPSGKESCPKAAAGEVKAKAQLLDQMGQWYMEASHLNDRQVLRHVQRCVSCQRSLTNGVSSQTLANVAGIVTRDLEKGERGRTTRMEWLVGMVAQAHGADEAESTVKALKGWRWAIERARESS
ncbi:hypothetical protein TOPH_05844 [Tolypocladium ophioglossoides CBS 100239]|uniref:Uncharacterized protein n=1 Tax=Tolypocladium ophioglossoides (strain CBS 100239) TaxID=1163406 RepID=A0A0L0N650_TOLOC|nr:hypothetical protein TOPH_05844 [Tolypocladium ophioglossoides CBS 100239]